MAFPSSTGTKKDDLQTAWNNARAFAARVKGEAQNVSSLSGSSSLSASRLLQFATFLDDARVQFELLTAVPGIGAYAQSQVSDPTLNIATEFTNMLSAIAGVGAWLANNWPKDASGFVQAYTMSATGRPIDRVFTAAQTAALRTQLDALVATIN